tara:strand:- start:34317 stop:34895 length:579 start_codon:yes stop_codon:yes gene_type:complete
MKKITLLILVLTTTFAIAQNEGTEDKSLQDVDKKYELKLNAFNLIALSSLDVSYEKLINSESSFGVALFYNFSDVQNSDIGFPKKFSVTPFYRWFFSESTYARGFFVEGFGMLNTYQDEIYTSDFISFSSSIENQTSFALGISVGGKFVTKSGFTTEVYLGVGRNLIKGNNEDNYFDFEVVGRFGISLGYRF